jgi:hypothetical protein
MQKIIKNVTVVYKDGNKKLFEAVSIVDDGVYTGSFNKKNRSKPVFVDSGFIPIDHVEKICGLSEEIDNLNIEYKIKKRRKNEK